MSAALASKTIRRLSPFLPGLIAVAAVGWFLSLETLLAALTIAPMLFVLAPGVWWRRAAPVPGAAGDLSARVPVWTALSELYLDTELDDQDRARITEVLARSGYGVHQLEEILYREVHPALIANLLSGLGEWAGFDEAWLTQTLLGRDRARWGVALVPAKCVVEGEWQRIRARVEDLLGGSAAPAGAQPGART